MAWLHRGDGLVAWGEAARCDVTGPERADRLVRWWADAATAATVTDPVAVPGSGLVAFGALAFDDGSAEPSALVVPRVVVGRRGQAAWITTIHDANGPAAEGAAFNETAAALEEAAAALDGTGPATSCPTAANRRSVTAAALPAAPAAAGLPARLSPPLFSPQPAGVTRRDGAHPREAWPQVVGAALEAIGRGEVGKVVLARDEWLEAATPWDLRAVAHQLARRHPTCWTYAVDRRIGATPELLVRAIGGRVASRVLAGTLPRDGHDQATAARLAASAKDLAEHRFAVDSVAETLAQFTDRLTVPSKPRVLTLATLMHLATDVTGQLADGETSLQLAAALHPTAAVCGTPREAARQLLARLEGMDRGRYAGPVGWMGADGDGEWGIALRGAHLDASLTRARLLAGGGIVAGSDPAAEAAEIEAKLAPMRTALGLPG
jgi:menaquinone-specific isochorismate synthase